MRPTRLIAVALLVAYLPACTSYLVLADPAATLQAPPKPIKKARVTIDSGKRFEVMAPRMNADSLQGQLRDGTAVSVPMSGIQKVEIREYHGGKTGWLIFGGILAVGAIGFGIFVYMISLSS